ncbi:enoyl-[acyl-carrier-protein] reductase, mitochondrial [Tanacetum coccineum]
MDLLSSTPLACARFVTLKTTHGALPKSTHFLRPRTPTSSNVRAFSAFMSPPSTAVLYENHGPPDTVTKLVELPQVERKANDVCVKMLASPIDPSDLNIIEGPKYIFYQDNKSPVCTHYPVRPLLPAVGGREGVGEVHSVGSSIQGLSPGDLVMMSPPFDGTWQTHVVKDQSSWHQIDKDTPVEYAATVSANPLNALRMKEDFLDLKSGDAVVQNGATSMVGQCAIQLAKLRGIHTINIIRDRTGSDEAKEKLKKLGADEEYTQSQLDLKNANVPDPALGFNCVGGSAATLVLKFLRQGGTMVTYGGMAKKPATVSTSAFIFQANVPDPALGFNCVGGSAATLVLKFLRQGGTMVTYGGTAKKPVTVSTSAFIFQVSDVFSILILSIELAPFDEVYMALDKSFGKLGSQPKQVIKF